MGAEWVQEASDTGAASQRQKNFEGTPTKFGFSLVFQIKLCVKE
jgi:hypothetical protein|tara:strand:+ start:1778 stop:1909 length:132 start_codon:yes stop_codon:yes gene_type:complete